MAPTVGRPVMQRLNSRMQQLGQRIRQALGRGLDGFGQPRLHCVRQVDAEDCGAACLATVAQQHGCRLNLGRARELVGTTASGTTLLGLKRGAEAVGFHARAARAAAAILEALDNLPRPLICHWRGRRGRSRS